MDLPPPNKITVDAAEKDHLINSVNVFQGGRAEVNRRVELELAKGLNHVHIVHLPNCIYEDSIRVEASGTAVISDVVNHSRHNRGRFIPTYDAVSIRSYSPDGNRRVAPVTPRYNPSLQALEDERSVIQKQIDFLNSYGAALDNRCSALNDMENFLESYGSRRRVLNKQLQDIDARIAQEEEEEARNQEQNQKVEDEVKFRGRRETNITVTVLAESEVKIELSLTYTVSEVSWTPSYDVRIPSSRSSNTSSTIILSYQGSVEQTTDEDWSNASLILSTTSPHFKAPIAPVLSTWQLRPGCSPSWRTYPAPASPYICGRGAYSNSSIFDRGPYTRVADPLPSRQGGPLPSPSPPARSSCLGDKYELGPPPAFNAADIRQAELVGSALGTTFKIPGRSNISSNSGTHKFLIGLFELSAEPEWTCVPSVNESVFLHYTITNSSGYALLAGEADVFKDDDLVCKSRIPIPTTQNESFVLPVGIDPSLQVTRAPLCTSKHTAPRSVFAFISLKKRSPRNITTNSQRFTIQNSGLTAVPALRVSDHIPVSSSPAVKVNITSPQELKPMVEVGKGGKEKKVTSWIDLSTGVHVRWAPVEGGGEGAVEWACAIEAGQKVDLKLEWEVVGDFY